jgi:hypothetical protein
MQKNLKKSKKPPLPNSLLHYVEERGYSKTLSHQREERGA